MGKWTEELYDDCTIDDDGSISHLGLGFNEDCYFFGLAFGLENPFVYLSWHISLNGYVSFGTMYIKNGDVS